MSETENGATEVAPDTGTVESATPNESVSWESTADSVADKLFPERTETGQFKGEAKAAPAEGETPAEPKPEASPVAASTEPEKPAIVAPQSLPADLKADLEKAPPAIQQWIAKREAESHQRISELGQTAKAFEPIRNVIDHYKDVFERNGRHPAQGIAELLEVQKMLDTDFDSAIVQIAKAYGRSLPGETPSDGQESGEVRALKSQIAALTRQVGETHNTVMARVNSEREQAQASLAKLVNEFASDKTDFKDIEQDIASHIAAIRNAEPDLEPKKLLEKAYDAARWANPVTRTKMLEAERKAETAKREEENKARALAAKKAGNLNVKSGSGTSPARKGSWEDTMASVADRVFAS